MKSVKEIRKKAGAGVAAMAMAAAMMMGSMPVYAAGDGFDMSTGRYGKGRRYGKLRAGFFL